MRTSTRRALICATTIALALPATMASYDAASAARSAPDSARVKPASTGPVSTVPASWTPWLSSAVHRQNVRELVQCGDTMYAVGKFSSIRSGSSTLTRHNAFSFSATTGAMTGWDPNTSGEVDSIALSPDCTTAYLVGTFGNVHGTSVQNIAAVDTSTGAVRTGFAHTANAQVDTAQFVNGLVIVGGQFNNINGVKRSRMASLDPTTGAPTNYLNLTFTGKYPRSSPTKVYNSQLSHAGDRLLIEGVFTSIQGQTRQQMAVIALGGSGATLDGWNAPELNAQCEPIESFYAKGGAWSPDDSKIYTATTGYKPAGGSTGAPRTGLCDAAASFPSTAVAVSHQWINYAGCDSLYSVVADASTVYVGGHERWANNGFGCDRAGTGAVSRSGVGGLDPSSGLATSWNSDPSPRARR